MDLPKVDILKTLPELDKLYGDHTQPDNNLLNGLHPDTPVFRYMSVCRFFDLVTNCKLELRKPGLWDDPFENHLSKVTFQKDGLPCGLDLTNDYFGQCWTLKEECDGFWRNYCSPKLDTGVRIETTAGELIRAVWDQSNQSIYLSRFVGIVDYLSDDDIKAKLVGCLEYGHPLTSQSGRGLAQAMLIKRTEFAYEQEIRVLAVESQSKKEYVVFKIDPVNLIHSIKFAPKLSMPCYEIYTNQLRQNGFPLENISRSILYDPWHLEL